MNAMSFFPAFAISFLLANHIVAQSAPTRHEAGLQFSGVNFKGDNTFNVLYKKAVDEMRYRRFRAAFGSLNVVYVGKELQSVIEAGIFFGVEKRRKAGEKLVFFDGWELGADITHFNDNRDNSRWITGLGIGYVLGLQHEFNDRWAMNIETVPGVKTKLEKTTGRDVYASFSVGFSSLASLAIVRKF